ncbi:VOC family protein [Rhodocaloribacter litoris]|uniref:VOC family protein n=1 Tax=Rhodocaloribacter litoris TaxID=2558931 RepID=UPI001420B75B|nr:VOC family protein [Rhodocaloribacter litoris]QXD15414.1 VOC family protein [Rhodocaloribacter litoris]
MARNPHFFSQLAHVEVLTTDLKASVAFFEEIVGLDVTGHGDGSVYLRAWGDYFHHSLKLTQADAPGLGHLGWRADSPEALDEVVAHIEALGLGEGWHEGEQGHGRAYRFRTPNGHACEVFWEVTWLRETGTRGSVFADRYASNRRRGVCPRRFDHVTLNTGNYPADKTFWKGLGLKNPDEIRINDDLPPVGGLFTVGNLSHDIAIFTDPALQPGEGALNHVCFNLDSREEVLLACDWFIECGYRLAMGPGRHQADEGFFIYVDEPGGNRFEFYAGARLVFAPDHGPDIHYLKDNPNDAWGNYNPWSGDGTFKPEHGSFRRQE